MRNKKYLFISIVILFSILYLIASGVFSFPDVFQLVFTPLQAALHYISPYRYLQLNKLNCVWLDATYPPLFYQFFTPYYLTIYRLFPILQQFAKETCPVWPFITNRIVLVTIKIPYLVSHLLSGYFISRLFLKNRRFYFLFWILQPIPIFVGAFMGQFDPTVNLFLIVSIFLLCKKRFHWAFLFLGIAGALKHIPYFFVPAILFLWSAKFKLKILAVLLLLLPYLVSLYFSNIQEIQKYVFGFSENTKMLSAKISTPNAGGIPLFPLIYAGGFLMLLYKQRTVKTFSIALISVCGILSFSPYFVTTSWFLQRIIYLVPFLMLFCITNQRSFIFLHLINFSYFAWAIFGYSGVLDSVLLRGMYPMADYLPSLANRFSSFIHTPVSQLSALSLGSINFIILLAFFLSLSTNQNHNAKNIIPTRLDLLFTILPLFVYTVLITINLF